MAGLLYLVPTPIGNLGDISQRCRETLEQADFIAAEDTRVSLKLLNHLGIKKSLVSYYEHNKAYKGNVILEPCYADARSFSNGYAAVCNEEGLWGVINSRYELVIDHTYLDILYFNSSETCWVSTFDGTVQLMQFMFS